MLVSVNMVQRETNAQDSESLLVGSLACPNDFVERFSDYGKFLGAKNASVCHINTHTPPNTRWRSGNRELSSRKAGKEHRWESFQQFDHVDNFSLPRKIGIRRVIMNVDARNSNCSRVQRSCKRRRQEANMYDLRRTRGEEKCGFGVVQPIRMRLLPICDPKKFGAKIRSKWKQNSLASLA